MPERDQALVEELVEELAEGLRQEVGFLREELARRNEELRQREEEHQEESRRKDSIIMAMTQRIPEIEASQEEAPGGPRDVPVPTSEAQKPSERRSWLYRFFFGP